MKQFMRNQGNSYLNVGWVISTPEWRGTMCLSRGDLEGVSLPSRSLSTYMFWFLTTLIPCSLAYTKISMVMAALLSPWSPEIRLHDTNMSDVDPVCAFLLPLPRLDSKGVRVVVTTSKEKLVTNLRKGTA